MITRDAALADQITRSAQGPDHSDPPSYISSASTRCAWTIDSHGDQANTVKRPSCDETFPTWNSGGSGQRGRNFEGDGEQCVACKDGNTVTENFVAGRAAAPEIVVVHARQIVVN